MSGAPTARFDDLAAGTALSFPYVHEAVVAHEPADVVRVLDRVEEATAAGMWSYGFVAYEAAGALDPSLTVHQLASTGLPLAWFGLTDAPVVVPPIDAEHPADQPAAAPGEMRWAADWSPRDHHRDVARVRSRIERGDTYQCNLTVRMRGRLVGDPRELYRNLVLAQRGAYNAYLDLGRFVIASASPELFFQRSGEELLLRPMKGTVARGRTTAEDRQHAAMLRTSAKERAENIMIVDLIRNDAARVARIGGVSVRSLCEVERYETVLQLTSEVAAQVRPGVGLTDLFRVLFPSGSVTGAPKVSTMALIRELESNPRGVYCGAIGYVAPPGAAVQARFNVAIRTAVVDRESGSAEYGVGGGITWSSEPSAEHAEVVAKTAVLHRRHREFELIETLRYEPELGLWNRDRHLRRLSDSAQYFGFRDAGLVAAVNELHARLAESGPLRVRLRLARTGALATDLLPLPESAGPVRLAIDEEPVDSSSLWLYHKTSLREPYVGRQLRHVSADDVVMINELGELTETTTANLALRLDGRWWTPEARSGCLPGVERARLVEQGRIIERVLTLTDLHRAEEIAVLNSLRGWRAAVLAEPPQPYVAAQAFSAHRG